MTLDFQKKGGLWIAEVEVTKNFALHLERTKVGYVRIWVKTTGEGYELKKNTEHDVVYDEDFAFLVYPKKLRIESTSEVLSGEITYGTASEEEETTKTKAFYVGDLTATKAEFVTLGDEIFSEVFEKRIANGEEEYFVATENCFVLLVPESVEIGSVSYTSEGITTNIKDGFNLAHDDVTLDGVKYKVYGYRMNVVTKDNPQVYAFVMKSI